MTERRSLAPARIGASVTTRLGLGGAVLAGLYRQVSEEQALGVVAATWDAGLRLFDTAPHYGAGLGEERLGAALAGRPRGELTLSTKVGRRLEPRRPEDPADLFVGAPPLKSVFDFSYDGVLRQVEASLARLRTDRVDIAYIHDPDDHHDDAVTGAYPALVRLRDEGTVGAIGVGMNQASLLARLVRELHLDCVLLAGRYSLLDHGRPGLDLLEQCSTSGTAVVLGGVFNSGILAAPGPGATFDYAPAPPEVQERVAVLAELCAGHDVELPAVALQFALAHPAVAAVVVGCRSPQEVADNVAMTDRYIPAGLWEELRRAKVISPDAPTPLS
ncbi:MAG TPA: aldo/keto reductase [Acidimicrobiales bacterium]|nr:aldo/keto reductase [Acidimicrobiales bacterium]